MNNTLNKTQRIRRIRTTLTWYSFIIVSLLCLVVLTYIPTIRTLYYSLTDMGSYGTDYSFVGLKNYRLLLTSGSFLKALKNTVVLTIYSLIKIPAGFLLADGINNIINRRRQTFFRVSFYLPSIITGVSVILIFKYVLKGNNGLLNMALSAIAGRPVTVGWLSDPRYSHIGVTILDLWMGIGYYMLMCLASLQSIPRETYDAAAVDGATSFKKLIYITIPQMKDCFAFLFVTSMIAGFARFTDLYILGGNSSAGRPSGSLQSLLMYIYQYTFETPKYGLSSAGSVILFILTLIFAIFSVRMSGMFKDVD
jgi:multiple sugar transport system permease protein